MKPWAEHITVATTCNLLVIRAVRRHVVRFADPPRPGSQIESGQMSSAKRVVVTGGRPSSAPRLPRRERGSATREMIGVGKAFAPPLPPNRTGGFPAYGSPVDGFLTGTVSLSARPRPARTHDCFATLAMMESAVRA